MDSSISLHGTGACIGSWSGAQPVHVIGVAFLLALVSHQVDARRPSKVVITQGARKAVIVRSGVGGPAKYNRRDPYMSPAMRRKRRPTPYYRGAPGARPRKPFRRPIDHDWEDWDEFSDEWRDEEAATEVKPVRARPWTTSNKLYSSSIKRPAAAPMNPRGVPPHTAAGPRPGVRPGKMPIRGSESQRVSTVWTKGGPRYRGNKGNKNVRPEVEEEDQWPATKYKVWGEDDLEQSYLKDTSNKFNKGNKNWGQDADDEEDAGSWLKGKNRFKGWNGNEDTVWGKGAGGKYRGGEAVKTWSQPVATASVSPAAIVEQPWNNKDKYRADDNAWHQSSPDQIWASSNRYNSERGVKTWPEEEAEDSWQKPKPHKYQVKPWEDSEDLPDTVRQQVMYPVWTEDKLPADNYNENDNGYMQYGNQRPLQGIGSGSTGLVPKKKKKKGINQGGNKYYQGKRNQEEPQAWNQDYQGSDSKGDAESWPTYSTWQADDYYHDRSFTVSDQEGAMTVASDRQDVAVVPVQSGQHQVLVNVRPPVELAFQQFVNNQPVAAA